ncbi:hypothetical protein [Niallia taxi]|uniref:hypothetical protein n=1 Tax=Niallia taxi TaxID=2499688 RepID=UPI001F207EE9|nr:hypothetical protein [Niallia taxi]
MSNYPVLEAFERNERGDLSVYCTFCKVFHHHSSDDGHKSAHCTNDESPYLKTGYIIKKTFKRISNG